jgi:hypothetical protein
MGCFFGLRPQFESDARAFDRPLRISPVQQGLAEPAIEERKFLLGDPPVREITTAGVEKTGTSAKLVGVERPCTNFTNVIHCAVLFEGRFVYRK